LLKMIGDKEIIQSAFGSRTPLDAEPRAEKSRQLGHD
jgi:hypothetical protein